MILKLLDDVKAYMQEGKAYVVYQMAEFIQKQLSILGLEFKSSQAENNSMQIVQLLNGFRTEIKVIANGELTKG